MRTDTIFWVCFTIFWVRLLVCFLSGSENGRCVASEYFTEPDIELTTENTANILSESGCQDLRVPYWELMNISAALTAIRVFFKFKA